MELDYYNGKYGVAYIYPSRTGTTVSIHKGEKDDESYSTQEDFCDTKFKDQARKIIRFLRDNDIEQAYIDVSGFGIGLKNEIDKILLRINEISDISVRDVISGVRTSWDVLTTQEKVKICAILTRTTDIEDLI